MIFVTTSEHEICKQSANEEVNHVMQVLFSNVSFIVSDIVLFPSYIF